MKAITFSIKTKQPILATSFQGDPNSDVSYPYIPGSMLRGVLIGRYLNKNRLQNTDIVANSTIRRLFFDGNTRYLNAYISSQQGQRTLPIPLPWKKEKNAEFHDENDAIEFFDFSVYKDKTVDSPKSIGEYFWIEEEGIRLYKVNRRLNIHNFRNRSKGRATEQEGEIFRYDAIDAGQIFKAAILCNEADEQIIGDLLSPSDLYLGGSRSAGYGHIEVIQIESYDSWNEVGVSSEDRISNNILKITLLSNMIIRDEWGQYVSAPPTRLLSDILGQPLANPKNTYTDSTLIGGFNRKWGLPLPQVPAIAAGSVFVYENVSITAEQIRQLETEGLGERIVEGFGRVAVNWRLEESRFTAKLPKKVQARVRNQPQLQTQESRDLARQIAERILRQKLEKLLLAQIEPTKLEPNNMTNSQLSRLMIVARQALDKNSRQPLDNLLSQLPSDARSQFERTMVGDQSLNRKIKEWLEQPKEWIENTNLQSVAIAGEKCNLSDELAMEYTLRLIMAVAKNAIKERANEQ